MAVRTILFNGSVDVFGNKFQEFSYGDSVNDGTSRINAAINSLILEFNGDRLFCVYIVLPESVTLLVKGTVVHFPGGINFTNFSHFHSDKFPASSELMNSIYLPCLSPGSLSNLFETLKGEIKSLE